ncbi:MAG: phage protease [Pseudomonadota bacterium]
MAQHSTLRLEQALAFTDEASVPAWIEVFPKGPHITARDGRSWTLDPQAVVRAFAEDDGDLVVDYEHLSEERPTGAVAAAGWVKEVEERDGAVWARVEWTERARAMIADREYRFVSPGFRHTKAGDVTRLTSVALVHKPALKMTALAHDERSAPARPLEHITITTTRDLETFQKALDELHPQTEGPIMKDDARKALCTKLELAPEASDQAVLDAVEKLQADTTTALARAETPSPDKFIPVATHNQVKGELETATARLKEIDDGAVEAKVDAAIAAKKIAPADRDFYLSTCRNDPEGFDKYVKGAPELALAKDSGLDEKKPDAGKNLSDEDKAMCAALGVSEEAYAATA